MIDIMQVAKSHDEVLRNNFVSQPPKTIIRSASPSRGKEASEVERRHPRRRKQELHMPREHKEARVSRKPSHPATTSRTASRTRNATSVGIWGHWSRICEEPQHIIDAYQAKRMAKAPAEAYLVPIDSAAGADAVAPSFTSTPLDILAAATIVAHEENVTQEQIFAKVDTFLDFV
ncbi:hypothetical protein E2562_004216 [Oryza meyeriana var. granulata]|uniref:Uncharacterized protein n=1 Tax=Oryza meyeriana var. granulata TaxID=110450 RepID=A0A6G1BQR7_9ORYZ|nr:hypothetical protein E2562_004216 [Oryza meyeriana var. granulata]